MVRRLPWWGRDVVEIGFGIVHLARLCRRLPACDLVFHRAGIYDTLGVRLADAARVPLIAHLDAPFAVERAFHRKGHFAILHRRRMRALGAAARLVVTVSESAAQYYAALGIPSEKIAVMPNGILRSLLDHGARLAANRPALSEPDAVTVGFLGSLSRWHRVDLLFQALRDLDTRIRCRIVGYGEDYERLRGEAARLGLDGRVTWTGPLPHERAFAEIAAFDVAVLPHTLATGVPMKLFEYAALARPIIAPDLPNLRGLFATDEVVFTPPGDPKALAAAIRTLVADPVVAREMAVRAQRRVECYSLEAIVRDMLARAGLRP